MAERNGKSEREKLSYRAAKFLVCTDKLPRSTRCHDVKLWELRSVLEWAMRELEGTPERKPEKQTSDRVSKIAARVLRHTGGGKRDLTLLIAPRPFRFATVEDVRALAASCLAQDETKGKRAPARKKKGARK